MAWHLSHCKAFTSSVITTPQLLHDINGCLCGLALLVACAGDDDAVAVAEAALPATTEFRLLAWFLVG